VSDLEKIAMFIAKHHVMSLATSLGDDLSVCSLFYVYDASSNSFIVASSDETTHIKHISDNKRVAGNILLETLSVGKIQGLQFKGDFLLLEETRLKASYFKNFPYALALNPKLWQIKVDYFKMTDNRLGFGKKIIWPAD
jgi:uncharacterized protein YhbP (UPF0306 family)